MRLLWCHTHTVDSQALTVTQSGFEVTQTNTAAGEESNAAVIAHIRIPAWK